MMWNRVFIAVFFFVLFSCKKDQKESGYQSDLPNFGNINIDKVFSKSDNYLHNKDSIKQKLIGYYRKNWEKGDLWGGFLVAKGDNILFERYQGFTDESQQKPINENTPIHIASVSKPFTAMAVLKLVEAGKLQLNQRIIDIFGKRLQPILVPIKEDIEWIKLHGYVAKPEGAKKSRGEQFFFVNNRYFKSPYLEKAVQEAFEGLLKVGYSPSFFLFLEISPEKIDINIHPQKTEIKFEDEHII